MERAAGDSYQRQLQNTIRSKRQTGERSISITLLSHVWGIKISSSSNLDEAQLWNSDPRRFNILLRSVNDCMIAVSLHPQLINPAFFPPSFFFFRRIKRMKRVENKSRDRGHAGCQAICSAIPDADHVDPGTADARLSGGTRKSNGE